jgi:GT2 family glycosyltransferase
MTNAEQIVGQRPDAPSVTIVVVPRERFNLSLVSLDTIYAHTETPFDLVYVDGNSPKGVRAQLQESAKKRGFTLVRRNRYLSPNEARAIGLAEVRTPYVVFVDNDLLVTPKWLDVLVRCADETGAWAVGPLYLEGDPADEIIHMAGGDLEFSGERPRRQFSTHHRLQGVPVSEAPEPVRREPCGFVEFHCMLVRTSAFEKVSLDQQLLSTREHLDLCLQIAEAGGSVWLEPASVVTYVTPPPVVGPDIPYFLLRWSESWNVASLAHFCDKYGIDPEYAARIQHMRARRQVAFDPIRRVTRRTLGPKGDKAVSKVLFRLEREVNQRFVRAPN